jgi:heme-degrading monooxygenase HmoA
MIYRIWHGWTTTENADIYEALLKEEIIIGIQDMQIEGFHGIQVLRRDRDVEVEFLTMMRFDSLDAVRNFAGEDYEAAYVPEQAREVLSRFDARSQHYELRTELLSGDK